MWFLQLVGFEINIDRFSLFMGLLMCINEYGFARYFVVVDNDIPALIVDYLLHVVAVV